MSVINKVSIWAITPGGLTIGQKLLKSLHDSVFFISANIADELLFSESSNIADDVCLDRIVIFEKLSEMFQEQFMRYDAHICIFSTGIAVRMAAPLISSKLTDPAIVVVDDRAFHAISLLSGHLGGANELTVEVAQITGASPVITTATDINRLPSIDMVAKRLNLLIENPEMIKKVNMAFLQGKRVMLIDPFNLLASYIPEQFRYKELSDAGDAVTVLCSDTDIDIERTKTLLLRPPSLVAGMGCNRGTARSELMEILISTFKEQNLSIKSLAAIATTSLKQDEAGLIELAHELGKPIRFYDKDELNSVETIENPSEMVEKHIGVKSVCEAAAILATQNGVLIVPKIKKGNATLAVARITVKNQV